MPNVGNANLTPPHFTSAIYPAHKVAALVGVLAEQGVAATATLADTGLSEARLDAPATRVSYRQVLGVFRNAMRLAPGPGVALLAGQRMHVTAYGMYGYALLSSPTHADAVDLAVRHHRMMGPVAEMRCERIDDEIVYSYRPLLVPDPSDPLYAFVTEFQLASHLTLTKDLYGRGFRFSQVRLSYPAPAHAALYHALLDCPVQFRQARDELRFGTDWLDEPMSFADPITHAMAREMCEKSVAEIDEAGGIAADIRRVLMIEQPGRFPSVEAMADALKLNARTLRRRLDAEQTSYRALVAEVRMRLAIGYLRETTMTNEEIASRLGYSDAANFRHAFARWTGKSPSEYRSA